MNCYIYPAYNQCPNISGEERAEGCDSNQYRKPRWQDNDRVKDNDIWLRCFKTDTVVFFVQSIFFTKKNQ